MLKRKGQVYISVTSPQESNDWNFLCKIRVSLLQSPDPLKARSFLVNSRDTETQEIQTVLGTVLGKE